jgi:hypothetical protein
MTSLSDVYEGEVRTVADRERRTLGRGLVGVGAVAVLLAVPIATTGVGGSLGLSVFESREFAGVLAGLGLPAVFLGIFAVLPTSAATRAGAAIGSSLAAFGVLLFVSAYPRRWLSGDPTLALFTTLVYGAGALITFWCLFISLATFKRRQDPGGTARMRVTEEGRLEIITDSAERVGRGAVGLFGRGPDGTVPTQTAAGGGTSTGTGTDEGELLEPESSADGAGAVAGDAVDDDVLDAVANRGRPDEYCGNCAHFDYVRAEGDLAPYCGLHDEVMDDMDACDEWTSNSDATAGF